MPQKNDSILELLSEFIHLRQSGTARDASWQRVLRLASEIPLSTDHVIKLLGLAKNWERTEGYKFHHDDEREITESERSETTLLTRTEIVPPPLPEETDITVRLLSAQTPENATYFDDRTHLVLQFDALTIPFKVFVPQNQEIIIGRGATNTHVLPDIDLSIAGEVANGVSRMHAALCQRNHTLTISDLGSRNFTYVNQARLHPHEVRVLKHGDEIRVANLTAAVCFLRK